MCELTMNELTINQLVERAIELSGNCAVIKYTKLSSGERIATVVKVLAPTVLKHPQQWAAGVLKHLDRVSAVPVAVKVQDGQLQALTATENGLEYVKLCGVVV